MSLLFYPKSNLWQWYDLKAYDFSVRLPETVQQQKPVKIKLNVRRRMR